MKKFCGIGVLVGLALLAFLGRDGAIAGPSRVIEATAIRVGPGGGVLTLPNATGTVVAKDGSGNFSAGTISANLNGNVTGNVTGNVSGTAANVTGVVGKANGGSGQDNSSLIFPATGTLATLAGSENLTNKSLTTPYVPDWLVLAEQAGGLASPSVGRRHLLVRNDGLVYTKQNNGTERPLVDTTTVQTLSNKSLDNANAVYIDYPEQALAPSSPGVATRRMYVKTDGKAYLKDSGGTEVALGTGTGGSSKNFVANPSAETGITGWTAIALGLSRDTSSGNKINGVASFLLSSADYHDEISTATMTLDDDVTGDCEVQALFKGDGSKWALQLLDGSLNVLNSLALTNETSWKPASFNYPCASGYKLRVIATASSPANINIGGFYWGKATNIGNVSQATMYGSVKASSCSAAWTTTSASMASFAAKTGCTYTLKNAALAPTTNIPAIKFASLPPGDYLVVATGQFYVGSTGNAGSFRLYDGTTSAGRSWIYNSVNPNTSGTTTVAGQLSYATAQSNITIEIQADASAGSTSGIDSTSTTEGLQIHVYRYPSAAEQVVRMSTPTAPTVQKFTSGSGTYTTPQGARYIRVRMVGGGGGGGGSGTATGAAATAGGNTTFGATLLVANGGAQGAWGSEGGTGGTASLGTGPIGLATQGGSGGDKQYQNVAAYLAGGNGGSSALGGGGGSGGYAAGGHHAATNSGSGGGGGGTGAAGTSYSGGGGGAGGFVDAIIANPATSYSFQVGSAGAGGGAGTSGHPGGNGAAGIIIVEEFYNAENAPLLRGSVTSNSSGLDLAEYGQVTCSGGSVESGNLLSAIGNISGGSCALTFTRAFASTSYSCSATPYGATGTTQYVLSTESKTTSGITLHCTAETSGGAAGACTSYTADIICMGPR